MRILTVFFALTLLTYTSIYAAKNDAQSAATSSSTAAKELSFTIPKAVDMLNAFANCTPGNIDDVIEKYSPAKILFEVNHILKYKRPKASELSNLFESAVYAYLILFSTTENSLDQKETTLARFQKAFELFRTNNTYNKALSRDQKKFIKANNTLGKLAKLKIDKFTFIKKPMRQKIKTAVQKIKQSLIELHGLTEERPNQTLTSIARQAQNRALFEQACLFGCRASFTVINDDFFYNQPTFDDAKNLRMCALLRYAYSSDKRHNYAVYLNQNGQTKEAKLWATTALEEGNEHSGPVLKSIKNSLALRVETAVGGEQTKVLGAFHKAMAIIKDEKLGKAEITRKAIPFLITAAKGGHSEALEFLPCFLFADKQYKKCLVWGLKAAQEQNINEGYFHAGKSAIKLGDFQAAIEYLTLYQTKDNDKSDVSFDLASIYFALKNYEMARQYCTQAMAEDSARAHILALNISTAEKDIDSARALILVIKEKFSKDKLYPKILLTGASLLMITGHYEEANQYLDESLYLESSAEGHYYKGLYYFCIKQDIDKALTHMTQADGIEEAHEVIESFTHLIKYYLGKAHLMKGHVDKALLFFKQANNKGMKKGALEAAKIHHQRSEFEAADRYFSIALSADVEGAIYHYILFLAEQQREQEAQDLFEDVVEDDDVVETKRGDDNSEDDSPDENDEGEPPLKRNRDLQYYVAAKDSKKYQRMLARAKKQASELDQRPESIPSKEIAKTYKDLNISLAPTFNGFIEGDNGRSQTTIKRRFSALANGRKKAGKFEKLEGFNNRFSMRIDKGNRVVFDMVGTTIVIIAAQGHYKNLPTKEYIASTGIKVLWSEEE